MKILKYLLYLFTLLILSFIIFLGYFTITQFNPEEKKTLTRNESSNPLKADTLKLLIWNIGYAGLDDDMSFFYDGGEKVRTTEKKTKTNLQSVINKIREMNDLDLIMLQEVDKHSRRSYFINEADSLQKYFPDYTSTFAYNYKVKFVPVPLNNPLGRVEGGLMTLSKTPPLSAVRYSFPGNFPWPKNLFMLDRCFLASVYQLKGGKKLYVINTHNSAYDDGELKEKQMNYLKKFITTRYKKGHFIIVGGDWNQLPPKYKGEYDSVKKMIPEDFFPAGWKWVYDPNTPTNRNLSKPYHEDSETSIIDFFLLSPNLKKHQCNTIDMNFQFSDHQPVFLKVLK